MIAMHHIFRDLKDIVCIYMYVDDLFVFSSDFQTHLQHFGGFARVRSSGLTLKPEKCNFAAREAKFLGYTFNKDGYVASTPKTKLVENFPVPKNQKAVRRFLGLTNYFKRHIKNYSIIASPLYQLLKLETSSSGQVSVTGVI